MKFTPEQLNEEQFAVPMSLMDLAMISNAINRLLSIDPNFTPEGREDYIHLLDKIGQLGQTATKALEAINQGDPLPEGTRVVTNKADTIIH